MKTVGIISNNEKQKAVEIARSIYDRLKDKGMEVLLPEEDFLPQKHSLPSVSWNIFSSRSEIILSVGGDGTFLRAAKHGQLDIMKGVSSNIMCGQEGYFGTSSFQVYLDIDQIKENTQSKTLEQEETIEGSFALEDENEPCSKTNISISSSINTVKITNTGNIDNNFDLDI